MELYLWRCLTPLNTISSKLFSKDNIMKNLLLIGMLCVFTTSLQAADAPEPPKPDPSKWGWTDGEGRYHHASTIAEGFFSGLGDLYRGAGFLLLSKGRYIVDFERTRRLYIDNVKHYIKSNWEIKDEYRKRFRNDHPDYVTRENHRLDMAVRRHELEQRKEKLRKAGVLLPEKKSSIGWNGQSYASYAAFKKSEGYKHFQDAAKERQRALQAKRNLQAQKERDAIKFLAQWDRMDYLQRERYKAKRDIADWHAREGR